MKQWPAILGALALLASPAAAEEYEGIFSPDDHCVAYRVVKDRLFAKDVVIVGQSCEVSARVVPSQGGRGPRVVVEVPVKSLKSGNVMRNSTVSGILGAKSQPNLRFSTEFLDVQALREGSDSTSFVVPGKLTIGGVDHAVSFPLEIVEFEGRRYVRGQVATSFSDFEMEPPTAGGGLIAKVHEELDLLVHIDLARVEGLAEILQ